VANGLRYLRTLRVRAVIHDWLYLMLAHRLLYNRIEQTSNLIHYVIISQSFTFLINSRFLQFCVTDKFYQFRFSQSYTDILPSSLNIVLQSP